LKLELIVWLQLSTECSTEETVKNYSFLR